MNDSATMVGVKSFNCWLLFLLLLITLLTGCLVMVKRDSIVVLLRGDVNTRTQTQQKTPQPLSQLGLVEGEPVSGGRKQQIRGIFRGWREAGVELLINDNKTEFVPLKSQVQYACLPSSTERVDKPGVRTKASESYMNLTASDGLGDMMSIEEIKKKVVLDDEVIVVGVASASGKFVGHQVFTLKCQ